jgi:hypothetical protein
MEWDASLALSAQRALVGRLSAAVRAVFVNKADSKLDVFFIVDGQISAEDDEEASCTATEMCADFPDVTNCNHHITRLDSPSLIYRPGGSHLVFQRREVGGVERCP